VGVLALLLAHSLALSGCQVPPGKSAPPDGWFTADGLEAGPGGDGGADVLFHQEAGITNDPTPRLVKVGGAGDGAIAGRLNVHVIDNRTALPINGAHVLLDDGSQYSGTTDAAGLITFRDGALRGQVNLSVAFKGYATASIIGLNAANVTLRLSPRSVAAAIKTGTCSGSVSGWNALPAVAKDHLRFARIVYLHSERDGDRNWIIQSKPGFDFYPPRTSTGATEWMLDVPTGKFSVAALVWDTDTKGTSTTKDDTVILTHVGVKTGLTVQQGQTVNNVAISVTPTSERLQVVHGPIPPGLPVVTTTFYLQLANKEVIPLWIPLTGYKDLQVAKLAGDFKGGNYWVTVTATESAKADFYRTSGLTFWRRGITTPATKVTATMNPLPYNLAAAAGGKLSFSLKKSVEMVEASLQPGKTGEPYWEFLFVSPGPGVSSFLLPTFPASVQATLPPSGAISMRVDALEIPGVSFNNATSAELEMKRTRSSRAHLALTW